MLQLCSRARTLRRIASGERKGGHGAHAGVQSSSPVALAGCIPGDVLGVVSVLRRRIGLYPAEDWLQTDVAGLERLEGGNLGERPVERHPSSSSCAEDSALASFRTSFIISSKLARRAAAELTAAEVSMGAGGAILVVI